MRNVIENMKNLGLSQTVINMFVILFIWFVFLSGIGSFFLLGYQIFNGLTPSPFLVGIVSTILGVVSALGIAAHQTSAIDGTATKVAASTVASLRPTLDAAAQSGQVNAETIQQVLQMMANQQIQVIPTDAPPVSSSVEANTQAVKENTAVTQQNTNVEQAVHHADQP